MISTLQGTRTLVTGAAGFLGSHLVARLVEEGAEVHAIDCLPGPSPALAALAGGQHTYHALDLCDANAVRSLVASLAPTKIFHLAADTNVGRELERMGPARRDIDASLNLLQTLNAGHCDCFVQAGTCEEYGDNPAPFQEDQPCNPVSPYSAAKSAITMFCKMLHKTHGFPIVILRPFRMYGPWQTAGFIPAAIRAALGDERFPMTGGEQTREFNYVTDVVDAFVRASVTPAAIGEVINVGNGIEYTLRAVVEKIAAIAGKPLNADLGALPYRPGETWHFYADNRKCRELLGWQPRVDLDTGLRQTIDWYRAQGAGD